VGDGVVNMVAGASSVKITPSGTVITGPLTINGIVFGTHKHTDIEPGSGTSGGPTS